VRVALLGDTTLAFLGGLLTRALAAEGIAAELHLVEYEQVVQALLQPHSALHAFAPEAAVFAFDALTFWPELDDAAWLLGPASARAAALDARAADLLHRVDLLRDRHSCPLLVHSFAPPAAPALGPADAGQPLGAVELVERLNLRLREGLQARPGCVYVDQVQLLREVGEARADDPKLRLLTGTVFSRPLMAAMAAAQARLLALRRRPARKALVLDLDHTLWGGVLGDDGPDALQLGPEGRGRAFQDLHRALLNLRARGVLLCVASKNDEAPALRALDGLPGGLLRTAHLSAWRIGWGDKARSIAEMAEELGLGLDAFAFLDDSPAERARVAEALPAVAVLPFPDDPARLAQVVRGCGLFDQLTTTDDDRARAERYAARAQVAHERALATDLRAFLEGLQMRLSVRPVAPPELPRAAQLTQKTNQFNLRTVRRAEDELRALAADPSAELLGLHLRDRLGDQGFIGLLIWRLDGGAAFIDTLLLSCRVLEREIERAAVAVAAARAGARGAGALRGEWRRTDRNARCRLALAECGMSLVVDTPDRVEFSLDLRGPLPAAPAHLCLEPSP
jgi:FkbH-like protein